MSSTIDNVMDFIKSHNKFAVTSHINPEGDSLGSQLAFVKLLQYLKKQYIIIDDHEPPKLFNFFVKFNEINYFPTSVENDFDAAVILDCPTTDRVGRVYELIKNVPILSIDHHISNTNFGDCKWVEPKASSCGEQIYKLFRAFDAPIDEEAATYLYVAMLTDTGSFKYDNTSSDTHMIIGDLIKLGVKPYLIAQKLFEAKPINEVLFLGECISNIKLYGNNRISLMYATKEMLTKYSIGPNGTEEFINFARSIEGVDVAIFIREDIKEEIMNVSFRSKGTFDVNKLASIFGGGGHVNASGCKIRLPFNKAKDRIIKEVEKFINKTP